MIPSLGEPPLTPTLTLTRALLRPWRAEDAPDLARNANDPLVARGLRDAFPHPYTQAAAESWLAMALASPDWLLAIEREGEAVGGIGVHFGRDVYHRTGEVGYWLAPAHWGQGVVTEALRAVVEETFARTGLLRLQACVFSSNPASMRVLQKAGFELEAIRRQAVCKAGRICDEHIYCRLRAGDPGGADE